MKILKDCITIVLILTFSLALFSCLGPLAYNSSNIYSSDIYIDEFNSFNTEMWGKENTFYGYSALKEENVSISNNNLVLKIPKNTTDGGGIYSLKKFRKGNFSIVFNNLTTNAVLELQIYNTENAIKGKILIYFSQLENTNIIEAIIESPTTNIQVSNLISNINFMMLSTSYQSIAFSYDYDNKNLLHFSDSRIPDEFFVKILFYLNEYNTEIYDRNSYVDSFRYERTY
ncbi:MAG: hypothetical protein ACP5PT_05480 [Brevinematia bacterium]